jgi:hypothetical protein
VGRRGLLVPEKQPQRRGGAETFLVFAGNYQLAIGNYFICHRWARMATDGEKETQLSRRGDEVARAQVKKVELLNYLTHPSLSGSFL